jgi:TIR domain
VSRGPSWQRMPRTRRMFSAKRKSFFSYSRKDMAFADRLESALTEGGFEPLIDRTEIYAFEDWWKRIENLIGQADTKRTS